MTAQKKTTATSSPESKGKASATPAEGGSPDDRCDTHGSLLGLESPPVIPSPRNAAPERPARPHRARSLGPDAPHQPQVPRPPTPHRCRPPTSDPPLPSRSRPRPLRTDRATAGPRLGRTDSPRRRPRQRRRRRERTAPSSLPAPHPAAISRRLRN